MTTETILVGRNEELAQSGESVENSQGQAVLEVRRADIGKSFPREKMAEVTADQG